MLFRAKDPGSSLTHLIAFVLAAFAAPPLLIHATLSAQTNTTSRLVGLSIFLISLQLLYAASSTYHAFNLSDSGNVILRKIDHAMIYILIAGSYTPICISVLPESSGHKLLIAIWFAAVIGVLFNVFWINCPKWLSSVIYLAMGWMCITVIPELWNLLTTAQFMMLLLGGIIYSVGGILYALKLEVFNNLHKNFGSHEIFHLFVMGGSICHFIFMWMVI